MQWRCVFSFCVFSAVSLRILLSHLYLVHSDDDFRVICGLSDAPSCHKVLTKYNSFYKHIRRKHDDVYKGHTSPLQHCNYFIVSNKEAHGEPENALSIHAGGEDQVMDDMTAVDVIEDLQNEALEHAILFIKRYMPGGGRGRGGVGAGQNWVGAFVEDRP